jgi:hypothetical protein
MVASPRKSALLKKEMNLLVKGCWKMTLLRMPWKGRGSFFSPIEVGMRDVVGLRLKM